MALFAFWQEPSGLAGDPLEQRLRDAAHIVPEEIVARRFQTEAGPWRLAAFATSTRYYRAADQIWCDPDGAGACIIHGLVWREENGRPRLLNAADVAGLLDRPGRDLAADICGEYAIARLYRDGSLSAFSDRAGLHHLFHSVDAPFVVANRAGFVATIRDDWRSDDDALLWLAAIGYRVGEASSYRVARAIPQEQRLSIHGGSARIEPLSARVVDFAGPRGFAEGGAALLDQGIVQAKAAIRLATGGDGPVDLPITGGKDSRAVLALCLAAGLRDRLRLFTRGYEGHPDVVAGRAIAAATGLPHARQAPLGSDQPAHWTGPAFFDNLAAQAFQTDGMMGGWDFILGRTLGHDTLITGHMGEVLKAYSKRPMPDGPLDPVAMVKLQAPFDPLALLRPDALSAMRTQLQAQMDRATAAGALTADLPDIFYYRNRIPNWLGGIRGIKSFERQPVMPLGVPALMNLAFRLSPEERAMELAHHHIIRAVAPELLAPAFAMQRWDARLLGYDPDLPIADPILPAASAPPVFGNWQYSLNHVPAIRSALGDFFQRADIGLWEGIDRDALLDQLRHRTFDYFDGIGLLGLVVAAFHETGTVRAVRMAPAASDIARTTSEASLRREGGAPAPTLSVSPALHGHFDGIRGPVAVEAPGRWRLTGTGPLHLDGWLRAPDHPGARIAIEARIDGRVVASTVADRPRPDLARAGLDDGAHGFALTLDGDTVRAAAADRPSVEILLTAFDSAFSPIGGRIVVAA
jgi:hypothetical protein